MEISGIAKQVREKKKKKKMKVLVIYQKKNISENCLKK